MREILQVVRSIHKLLDFNTPFNFCTTKVTFFKLASVFDLSLQ